jgi:hypothetical protein
MINLLEEVAREEWEKGNKIIDFSLVGRGSNCKLNPRVDKRAVEDTLENNIQDLQRMMIAKLTKINKICSELSKSFRKKCEFPFSFIRIPCNIGSRSSSPDPNTPGSLYVRSSVDPPSFGQPLPVYEIWRTNQGELFYARRIKEMKPNSKDVSSLEMRALVLKHVIVLPLRYWKIINTSLYYVYDYIEETLDHLVKRGANWSKKEVEIFAVKLLQGMRYLHSKRIHYCSDVVFVQERTPTFGFELIDKSMSGDDEKPIDDAKDGENLAKMLEKVAKLCNDPELTRKLQNAGEMILEDTTRELEAIIRQISSD